MCGDLRSVFEERQLLLLLLLLLYSRTGPRRALSLKLSDTRVYTLGLILFGTYTQCTHPDFWVTTGPGHDFRKGRDPISEAKTSGHNGQGVQKYPLQRPSGPSGGTACCEDRLTIRTRDDAARPAANSGGGGGKDVVHPAGIEYGSISGK